MSAMDAAIGRTVSRVFVAPGEHTLYLDTEEGVLAFAAVGDCCSQTWFADITGVDALIGARVVAADDLEMEPVDDNRGRSEVDQFYGVQLTTPRGRVVIAYRNSSNGYYGGWMEAGRPIEAIPADAREITDDWSA